jgi:hypothetical protein
MSGPSRSARLPAGSPGRRGPGPIIEVACWAHVRRKFFDVHEAVKSPIAAELLSRIGQLYAVEAGLRGKSAEERRAGRDQLSPLLQGLEPWSQGQLRSISAKSPLADAFCYMLNRWAALTRFLDDGRPTPPERAEELSIPTPGSSASSPGSKSGCYPSTMIGEQTADRRPRFRPRVCDQTRGQRSGRWAIAAESIGAVLSLGTGHCRGGCILGVRYLLIKVWLASIIFYGSNI